VRCGSSDVGGDALVDHVSVEAGLSWWRGEDPDDVGAFAKYHRRRRWRLEAQVTRLDGDRCITVADLDSYIPTVNDARLRFERMRDLCATHPAQPWRGLVADDPAVTEA